MQQTRSKTELMAVLFGSILLFAGLGIWWALQEPTKPEISSTTNTQTTRPGSSDSYAAVPEDKKDLLNKETPTSSTPDKQTPAKPPLATESPSTAPKIVECEQTEVANGYHTFQSLYSTNSRTDPTRRNLITNNQSGSNNNLFSFSDPDVGGTSKIYDVNCKQMTTKQLQQQTNRKFIIYTDYRTSLVQVIQFIE